MSCGIHHMRFDCELNRSVFLKSYFERDLETECSFCRRSTCVLGVSNLIKHDVHCSQHVICTATRHCHLESILWCKLVPRQDRTVPVLFRFACIRLLDLDSPATCISNLCWRRFPCITQQIQVAWMHSAQHQKRQLAYSNVFTIVAVLNTFCWCYYQRSRIRRNQWNYWSLVISEERVKNSQNEL